MNIIRSLLDIIKRYFVSGVLIVVPLILTYLILRLFFDAVDGILGPVILKIFGYYVPGLGLVATLLLILLAGVITRNFIGARLYDYGERVLVRLPLVRPIYSSAKQLLQAMTATQNAGFSEVALVAYPRKGSYSMCFVAGRTQMEQDGAMVDSIIAYVPSTPTPVSGMVVVVPETDVILLDMTVEEGIKFIVSGGVASPAILRRRAPGGQSADSEDKS
ncbi:MAG: DUF502 domain-containing protein [candidate division Zixibacteria bacterium]|jgi:uncharacterized membrane protein|nr:DUF502 domain-containing protein [candidate division Zixibacteria bacterium]